MLPVDVGDLPAARLDVAQRGVEFADLVVTEAIDPVLARPDVPSEPRRPPDDFFQLDATHAVSPRFIAGACARMSTFSQIDCCKSTFRLLNAAYGRHRFRYLPALRHPAGADFGTDR